MAEVKTRTLSTRIKQLVMTSAQWDAKNPVLLAGEYGYDSTTGKCKVGDGTKTWSQLSYSNAASADAATKLAASKNFSIANEVVATAVGFDGSGNVELSATIADGVIDNANISSTAAIAQSKIAGSTSGKSIADDLTSLGSDISDETSAREAADTAIEGSLGLSSGEKLTFTPTVTVGGAQKGTAYSEKSVQEMLEQILCPYVATSGQRISGKIGNTDGQYGSTYTITALSAAWTKGSTDVTKVEFYVGSIATANLLGTVTNPSGTSCTLSDISVTIDNNTAKSFLCKVYDSNGSKSYASSAQSYGTWYKPYYFGVVDAVPTDGAGILTLTKMSENWPSSGTKQVTFGTVAAGKYCVVAIASDRNITMVKDPSGFDNTSSWIHSTPAPTSPNTVELTTGDMTYNYKIYWAQPGGQTGWYYTFS